MSYILQNYLYAFNPDKSLPDLPKDAEIFDLSDYLKYFPHSLPLPQNFIGELEKYGHLCQWMAYATFQKGGPKLDVSRGDVRTVLSKEEVFFGRDCLEKIKKENSGKKVLVISPYATTKNRNIPKPVLEKIVADVSDLAVSCQTLPYGDDQKINGAIDIEDKDIRKAIAIRLASDAYLAVDSGPLHMMMGAIQGTPKENLVEGINPDPAKVFVVLGSSMKEAVAYSGNQTIFCGKACEIAPCGAHGYHLLEDYGHLFGKIFYSASQADKSGCIDRDFGRRETAGCMEAVKAEEVIEKIRDYLKKN